MPKCWPGVAMVKSKYPLVLVAIES